MTMTDPEWSALCRDDRKKAFTYLAEQFGNLIYAIVLSKLHGCGTREDIEDCVSDIMVEVFRNAGNYSAEAGSLKTYVSTIAKRRAIDCFRQLSHRSGMYCSIDDETVELPPDEQDTENEAEQNIMSQNLRDIIQSLGEPDSSIIIYQYFYRLTVKETAKKLSMTSGAVQKRSVRARKKLAQMLGKGE